MTANCKTEKGVLENFSYTLNTIDRHAVAYRTDVVRRLTPLECERLQGLPSNWTLGGSNYQRYKAIGNGMALPIAEFILKRIKKHCEVFDDD